MERLLDYLNAYADRNIAPMHMPGHKRNYDFLQGIDPVRIDLTEVEGSDNLHYPEGVLKEVQDYAAQIYGARRTWFLVNGSSCGLLASIFALGHRGEKILVARNCHKAVYNGIHLSGMFPVYLFPEVDTSFGVSASITPAQIEQALQENPDIRLVILTSPTYDGVTSDIPAISELLHSRGIPLIVDEAHGAHFGFHPTFPPRAISLGADLVIQSIHKTLPCPTQTALLHFRPGLWKTDAEADQIEAQVSAALRIFESTSPSYIFMAAIDNCVHLMEEQGNELFTAYRARLDRFSEGCRALKHIRVLCKGDDVLADHPLFYGYDDGKVVVSLQNLSLTSGEFEKLMLDRYKIELEMIAADYVLAMTSICDPDETFDRLLNALLEIDAEYGLDENASKPSASLPSVRKSDTVMTISEANDRPDVIIPLDDSVGRIAREILFAYPPGIPLVVPGERISQEMIDQIHVLLADGVTVKSAYGHFEGTIHVIAE